jgi:cytochrome c peroxidase
MPSASKLVCGLGLITLVVSSRASLAQAPPPPPPLPPAPVPAENPMTEAKRVLGKILFFEEQISTSNVVSCATCHVSARAGADPRLARNPGLDGLLNSPDDILGSPGIIKSDQENDYVRDAVFALSPQITGRSANSPINAAYAVDAFWDGRARSQFIDPQTGQVAIASGGALESQSVGPIVNNVEMAHAGYDWAQVAQKLQRVRPLDLATSFPADVLAPLGTPRVDYAELFRRAFGDTAITARRIAFAIATYERTLIANQTPWDAFRDGNQAALTPNQVQGLNTFQANCAVCHTPPTFSDQSFRNIGIRPPAEDLGRQVVTGNAADRGKFKVPGLRNAGLKRSFMHNGQFPTVGAVVAFYTRAPGSPPQFQDNLDPLAANIRFGPTPQQQVTDFLVNGLTDPRVASQQFPFDRATLYTERPGDQATIVGGGTPGTGGVVPQIIAQAPPMVGNLDYRVGLNGTPVGATAQLAVSTNPPVNGLITPERFAGSVVAIENGFGQGIATLHWPLTPETATGGQVLFLQWQVDDAGASGGKSFSAVARVPVFCGSAGCQAPCGYANCDGSNLAPYLNVADFTCFLQRYSAGDPYANCDGSQTFPALNVADFTCFLQKYAMGCPR